MESFTETMDREKISTSTMERRMLQITQSHNNRIITKVAMDKVTTGNNINGMITLRTMTTTKGNTLRSIPTTHMMINLKLSTDLR